MTVNEETRKAMLERDPFLPEGAVLVRCGECGSDHAWGHEGGTVECWCDADEMTCNRCDYKANPEDYADFTRKELVMNGLIEEVEA
jgi:hypothetical protein